MITFQFLRTGLISSCLLLSGCSSLNSQFDCPMTPGVMCKSLDEVNTMVDQGKLGFSSSTTESSSWAVRSSNQEKLTRIWLAPDEDKDGKYYPSTFLYREVSLEAGGKVS